MTVELKEREPVAIDGHQFYKVVADLCEIADLNLRRSEYFSRCFETIVEFFNAGAGILNLRIGPRTIERSYEQRTGFLSQWHDDLDSLILRAQSNETSLLQKYSEQGGLRSVYAIAAPILSPSCKPFGAVGLIIPASDAVSGRKELALLSQLLQLVVVSAPNDQQPADNKQQSLQSVVRAADYQSIQHLCFAIVNSLCVKLGCEQVTIGLAKGNDIRLIAVSGLSEVPKSTPGMQAVHQAMATCLDRNSESVFQEAGRLVDQCDSSTCKVHHFWHRISGGSNVATIPLQIEGKCVAVLGLRRKSHSPFVPEDLKRARVLGESFAPALPLVDKASRSVVKHASDAFVGWVQKWYGWKGLGRKTAALLAFVFAIWFIFGHSKYEVLAPCKIAAKHVLTVASPFDGLISGVFVKPGQRVAKGQVLVEFDKDELLTERNRVLTKISSTRIESNALLQQRKTQEAFVLQSELEVLNAELQLINQKLAHSVLRANVDGIVLPTEIHRRIGQFVVIGEPLLEVADEEEWHLEIETPENEIRHLAIGQLGKFQSRARPDLVSNCCIESINPSSQIVDSNNVVIADAHLQAREKWMKIGMQGTVRVDVGIRPVWWVYLHPLIDYARLRLWL